MPCRNKECQSRSIHPNTVNAGRSGISVYPKCEGSSLCAVVGFGSATIFQVGQVIGVLTLALCLSAPMLAQDGSSENAASRTRAAQIQAERLQKATELAPEQLTPGENHLTTIKDTFERLFQKGDVHLQMGGLPSGSGFGIGPVFQWSNSTDSVRAGFSAIGSLEQYYRLDAGLTFPKLGARSLALSIQARRTDAPGLNYYGSGPSSRKGDRTDYREEDTAGELSLRWAPLRQYVTLKADGGEVFINVGPGIRDDIPSTDRRFEPGEAPGIDVQTNFMRAASTVEFDGRETQQ